MQILLRQSFGEMNGCDDSCSGQRPGARFFGEPKNEIALLDAFGNLNKVFDQCHAGRGRSRMWCEV